MSRNDTTRRIEADLEKLQQQIDRLRERMRSLNGNGKHQAKSILQRWEDAGLIGCIKDAPPDLGTNPKHMEGFGES